MATTITKREKMRPIRTSRFHIKKTIAAFTILEVTIVLAIMSVMITIIAVSSNRFQEQVKQTSIIQEELNHFYSVRSNLWLEMYTSDSIQYEDNLIQIYQHERAISYTVLSSTLFRKQDLGEWINLKLPMIALNKVEVNHSNKIEFIFDWKGEPMKLHYFCSAGTKEKIDDFFTNYPR